MTSQDDSISFPLWQMAKVVTAFVPPFIPAPHAYHGEFKGRSLLSLHFEFGPVSGLLWARESGRSGRSSTPKLLRSLTHFHCLSELLLPREQVQASLLDGSRPLERVPVFPGGPAEAITDNASPEQLPLPHRLAADI